MSVWRSVISTAYFDGNVGDMGVDELQIDLAIINDAQVSRRECQECC